MTTVDFAPGLSNNSVPRFLDPGAGFTSGKVSIRPMATYDFDLLRSFFRGLSPLARHRRFMSPFREVPDSILRHLSNIDQEQHVAYLAETTIDGKTIMVAEARYMAGSPEASECEFAIAVADNWQGRGIGRDLLCHLEREAVRSQRHELVAETLPENAAMIGLARHCGFSVGRHPHDCRVKKLAKRVTLH